MTLPLTVLMCVHNGEEYLREAVDSILGQTFPDFELLVVEDASSDRTPQILASYADPRLRVVKNEVNRGLTKSLNIGLRAARGTFVARHDADDRSHPERFERQVRFLEANLRVAIAGTGHRNIDERGRLIRTVVWPRLRTAAGIRWQFMFENPFSHSAVMFRRAVILDEMGGYDEQFHTMEDFDLWSRVAARHPVTNLLEPLVDLRSHSVSMGAGRTPVHMEMIRTVLRWNLTSTLGDGDYEPWLDFWMSVNNPASYPAIANLEWALSTWSSLRTRYRARYPDAAGEPEIDRSMGGSLARVSETMARQNRRVALAAYGQALGKAPRLALRALPRFAAGVVLGRRRWRRA